MKVVLYLASILLTPPVWVWVGGMGGIISIARAGGKSTRGHINTSTVFCQNQCVRVRVQTHLVRVSSDWRHFDLDRVPVKHVAHRNTTVVRARQEQSRVMRWAKVERANLGGVPCDPVHTLTRCDVHDFDRSCLHAHGEKPARVVVSD
jgi:hypothetical protein